MGVVTVAKIQKTSGRTVPRVGNGRWDPGSRGSSTQERQNQRFPGASWEPAIELKGETAGTEQLDKKAEGEELGT